MPHYEIPELERYNAYVTTVERREALFNAFENYKKAFSKGKILKGRLPPLLLDEEVYIALSDPYNERARDNAADFIVQEINEILAKLEQEKEQEQVKGKNKDKKKELEKGKGAGTDKKPEEVKKREETTSKAVAKAKDLRLDIKHRAASREEARRARTGQDKLKFQTSNKNAERDKLKDTKSSIDTEEALEDGIETWEDEGGSIATWDDNSNNDKESVHGMHLGYDAHVKAISSRLKALALETPIEYIGKAMDQKTYVQNTEHIYENIHEDFPEDIFPEMDPDTNTLTVSIPSQDNTSEDVIIRSYDSVKKHPKLSITNPPDDHSIIILLDMNKDMMPLTMTNPCHNENTAIRIFEASVISGRPVNLAPEDSALLRSSKEYGKRFHYLESLLQPNGTEQLKVFKKWATENEDFKWQLGVSDIPPKFYREAPMYIAPAEASKLDFEPTKPKGKRG
jgi:hypothetical protein